MSVWAEIKHAVNSSLGTSDFKPLNEIILQTKDLAASDTVYKVIYPSGASNITSANIQANRNGSIRILLYVTANSTSQQRPNTYNIKVFDGSTKIVDYSQVIAPLSPAQIVSVDFPIAKGHSYEFVIGETGTGVSVTDGLAIGAVELDVTGITIL